MLNYKTLVFLANSKIYKCVFKTRKTLTNQIKKSTKSNKSKMEDKTNNRRS